MERVRFTSTGTEAATLAARIARRATGRRGLVLFEDGYHGTAIPFADGGDPAVRRVPYNDLDRLEATLDGDVAALFAEPFLGSGGVIPAAKGFLAAAARLAHAAGALFVLDEVQSLRNAFAGVHGALRLDVDLVLAGKFLGGGLPVGVVGGRAQYMELTVRDVVHSGTFNGNAVTVAAGFTSLAHLDEHAIDLLNARARRLAAAIERAGAGAGFPVRVRRAGSIMNVEPPAAGDLAALHLALLLEGVYAAPRGMLNLSTAVGDEQLDAIAASYGRAFERIGAGV